METLWETHRGRIVGAATGFLLGLIYLIIGFWKTLVFGMFVFAGYWVGRRIDNREDLTQVLETIIPEKWFRK